MRKRKSVLKPLAIIFVAMFLLNMAVMRICFNINVIGATAWQEVMHTDMVRSLLLAAENEADVKSESIEDIASASPDNAPMSSENAPAGQDNTPISSDTTSTGPDTMPTSPDTEASLYAVSPVTVAALQHLSRTDKFVALTILSKMGRDEINRIFEISKDGITFDEYEELRVLAENRLKPSDIEALKEILSKNQGLFAQNLGEEP